MRIVVAPDKFKGTATALELTEALGAALRAAGHEVIAIPLADGGEGFLDVFGGPNRVTTVDGPLGDEVDAAWRLDRGTAVIEMARAAGLTLVGGAEGNDPIAASTYGVGELIATAVETGARRVLVGVGGSATTDGGLGALRALHPPQRFRGVEIIVACDVRTRFVDAATVFAPQKGATRAQVELLRRVHRIAERIEDRADLIGDVVRQFDDVEGRGHDELGEGTLTVDADTAGIGVKMEMAGAGRFGSGGRPAMCGMTATGFTAGAAAPQCQAATGWLLQMNTWTLQSLGDAPQIFRYGDGLEMLRVYNADAAELRCGYYANLACNAPGWNSQVTLGV
jgi:hypothetical protein